MGINACGDKHLLPTRMCRVGAIDPAGLALRHAAQGEIALNSVEFRLSYDAPLRSAPAVSSVRTQAPWARGRWVSGTDAGALLLKFLPRRKAEDEADESECDTIGFNRLRHEGFMHDLNCGICTSPVRIVQGQAITPCSQRVWQHSRQQTACGLTQSCFS